MSHISRLQLKHFTAFTNVQFDFVDGVNAVIGENGTGKTHLLKALYAMLYSQARTSRTIIGRALGPVLEDVFQTRDASNIISLGAPAGTGAEGRAGVEGSRGLTAWTANPNQQ